MMIHLANSHGDTIAFDGARSEVGEVSSLVLLHRTNFALAH
jgi:hypothetical protein